MITMQTIYKYLSILFLTVASVWTVSATVSDAEGAYASADYAKAIELYQNAINESSHPTAEMYYNLGCALFKDNQLAPALLAFERAYLIDPSDSDTKYNIRFVNARTRDKIDVAPTFFISRWFDTLSHSFMLHTWLWGGLIFFLLTVAALLGYLIGRERRIRVLGFSLFWVFLCVSLLANSMAYMSYSFSQDDTKAIVMADTVTVKSAPDLSSEDLFIIHSGLKVEILQKVNGFVEVMLPDRTVGWMSSADLEVINVFRR